MPPHRQHELRRPHVNDRAPTRRLGPKLLSAGLIAVGAVAVLNLPVPHRARAGGRPPVAASVTISSTALGRAIPRGFIGFSLEYPALPAYAGTDPRHVNPVFEALLRNLNVGEAPVLRIGGDSTDVTWWPMRRHARPRGITYSLSPTWLRTARALAEHLHVRLILGVNLEAGRPDLSLAEARAMLAIVGRRNIAALELGNEPGLYGRFPYYRNAHGRFALARRRSYGMPQFTKEFSAFSRQLPGVPLAGPTLGLVPPARVLRSFLAAEPSVTVATLHRYPLNRCFVTKDSPKYPTIPHLLSPFASAGLRASLGNSVAITDRAGIPLRIDELGSVACSGAQGVSDTFASALWSLDELFYMARAGVAGVNFHTFSGAQYAPFTFGRTGGRWWASVRPEYYGLLTFAQAAPPGSRLLNVRTSGAAAGHLSAWATRAPGGQIRVILINKSMLDAERVQVRVPASDGPGVLTSLRAPTPAAKTGVTLGGRSFAAHTRSGRLTGAPSTSSIAARAGTYTVTVPAASASVMTLAPSASGAPSR